MARHENNFEGVEKAELSEQERDSLARSAADVPTTRANRLACFISAAEGWDEAARQLDGAFADCPALREAKD